MKTYRFTTDYASGIGAWKTGDTAEFDDVTAQWLLRDVSGVIEPVEDGERSSKPRQNRQVRKAPNDRGPGQPIDRSTFKATKG